MRRVRSCMCNLTIQSSFGCFTWYRVSPALFLLCFLPLAISSSASTFNTFSLGPFCANRESGFLSESGANHGDFRFFRPSQAINYAGR
ncbi:hypothetical protein QBC36DRAFT_339482 [Triangularia setosa]|uniref:Uncharacterized protein n=1 Tax=Triangularia setosa TaxID=2587417 RepID=A0AAN6VXM5_9PEZI|nr:hypothetical protein QBC36DRAFT_339482 [Podospora setosa]